MAKAEDNINAALGLSLSILNSLYELKVLTLEQAQQTVEHAISAVAEGERGAVRAALKKSIPAFVK